MQNDKSPFGAKGGNDNMIVMSMHPEMKKIIKATPWPQGLVFHSFRGVTYTTYRETVKFTKNFSAVFAK